MNENFYRARHNAGDHYGQATYNLRHWFNIPAVKQWLKEHQRIELLDAGCGGGVFCRQIYDQLGGAARIPRSVGVDMVDAFMDPPVSGFQFKSCNLNDENLPFEDGSFDLIFCNHVIEHLFNTEHLLSELYRVARPGGLTVVSTPNLAWWPNRILLLAGIQPVGTELGTGSISYGMGFLAKKVRSFRPAGHIRCFTPAALRDMSIITGFEPVGWWRQDFSRYAVFPRLFPRNIGIVLHRNPGGMDEVGR